MGYYTDLHQAEVLRFCEHCDKEYYVDSGYNVCIDCGNDFVDPGELPEVVSDNIKE